MKIFQKTNLQKISSFSYAIEKEALFHFRFNIYLLKFTIVEKKEKRKNIYYSVILYICLRSYILKETSNIVNISYDLLETSFLKQVHFQILSLILYFSHIFFLSK